MQRIVFCIMLHISTAIAGSTSLDSIERSLDRAAKDYSQNEISALAVKLQSSPPGPSDSAEHALLLGLALWRLQLIAFCEDDKAAIDRYGSEALKQLTAAQSHGADPYVASSHRALVAQLLAGLGLRKATVFGPRSARELSSARLARPGGYFIGFIEATTAIGAPAFAGGNPQRAIAILDSLRRVYPDSVDIDIQKARALLKAGERDSARNLIREVIKRHPKNRLALKVARDAQ